MHTTTSTQEFFDTYIEALLARDASALADLYAVPALILFPGNAVPVSDASQTEQFFAGAFGQYEGITEAHADVTIVAETGHSVWADAPGPTTALPASGTCTSSCVSTTPGGSPC